MQITVLLSKRKKHVFWLEMPAEGNDFHTLFIFFHFNHSLDVRWRWDKYKTTETDINWILLHLQRWGDKSQKTNTYAFSHRKCNPSVFTHGLLLQRCQSTQIIIQEFHYKVILKKQSQVFSLHTVCSKKIHFCWLNSYTSTTVFLWRSRSPTGASLVSCI